MPLPSRYEVPRGVTLVSADPMSLDAIAGAISAQTGIPIRLSALTIVGKAGGASGASATPGPGGAANLASANASLASTNAAHSQEVPISYEGPLSGLLDRLSANFNVSWRYDGSSITILRYETRIFVVEALPGSQQVEDASTSSSTGGGSGSSSGGGGGSSGGGSSGGSSGGTSSGGSSSSTTLTQNTKFTMDFKYWEELEKVLNSMVGSQGSVVVSPAMGTVTVTATGDVMETVSDYIAKENKRLSRQIAINVQIYSVNLGQSEDFNLAFSSFLNNLTKITRISYTTGAAPTIANTALSSSSLGALSVAILNGANSTTGPVSDVFSALSTIGNTSTVAQFPMMTLNNRPVSRIVGTNTAYVSSVTANTTTSAVSTGTTLYTPQVSTIQAGFTVQLTPRVLDDGRILLQYTVSSVEELGNPPTQSFDGNLVTLPVLKNRLFAQQSMLRSGQTLMIGGVDQEDLSQNKNGVGSPDNFLLGGGASSNTNHYMMFMAITPQVMDVAGEGTN